MKIAAALLAMVSCVFAQDAPAKQDDKARALELLDAAAAVMKDSAAIAVEYSSDPKQKTVLKLRRPNLARVETSGGDEDMTVVYDGKNAWVYFKSQNEYLTASQPAGMAEGATFPIGALFYDKSGGRLLEGATEVSVSKEKLEDEELDRIAWKIGERNCRLWIDARKAVRRFEVAEDNGLRQVVALGTVDLAPKLADDTFTFTPPPGAKEAGEPLAKDLLAVGSEAPDFEATDLEGKAVKLSDFKGKTVLVNFWFYG